MYTQILIYQTVIFVTMTAPREEAHVIEPGKKPSKFIIRTINLNIHSILTTSTTIYDTSPPTTTKPTSHSL